MTAPAGHWYWEVSIALAPADVEAVANYIIENICGGLLFEDEDGAADTGIRFYVGAETDLDNALAPLRRYLAEVSDRYLGIEPTVRKINDLDWIDAYKKSVESLLVGDRIVIKPPWDATPYSGLTEIILEPKMAFGTGRHETTRSCLAELEQLPLAGKRVLDMGCGSGVLGIYAARRGAALVHSYDTDPLATENSRENFAVNGVAEVATIVEGGIDTVPSGVLFDVIVVNIIKSVILEILPRLNAHLAPHGVVILSGLLCRDRPDIASALSALGFSVDAERVDGEWLTLRAKSS